LVSDAKVEVLSAKKWQLIKIARFGIEKDIWMGGFLLEKR
jgi:hypothetical protein